MLTINLLLNIYRAIIGINFFFFSLNKLFIEHNDCVQGVPGNKMSRVGGCYSKAVPGALERAAEGPHWLEK